MKFDSPELVYKAVEYANSTSKPEWVSKTIKLTKRSEGYGAGSNQILVKVHGASLNPVDSVLYNTYHQVLGRVLGRLGIGFDYSGIVVSIGSLASKKTHLKEGDEVVGLYAHPFFSGAVSEYLMINPCWDMTISRKPESLSLVEAAALPMVYGTAEQMVQIASVKPGDKVLVFGGATSVGRILVQILNHYSHASQIVATCSDQSESLVRELGAGETINYRKHTTLTQPILQQASSRKFDAIFDCVGNSDLFEVMDKVLQPKKYYVTICGERKLLYTNHALLSDLFGRSVSFSRSFLGFIGYNNYRYRLTTLVPGHWMHKGSQRFDDKLKILIDTVYSKDDFLEAFERLRSNKASGKIIVQCNH